MSPVTNSSQVNNGNAGLTLGRALMKELRETREKLAKRGLLRSNDSESKQPKTIKGLGSTKRRVRARRSPVWGHFLITDDEWALCKQCEYKTKSVYSTNLKLHLKSHHRRSYEQVLRAEQFTPFEGTSCRALVAGRKSALVDALSSESAHNSAVPRGNALGAIISSPPMCNSISVRSKGVAPLLASILNDEKNEALIAPPLVTADCLLTSKAISDHLFEKMCHTTQMMDAPSLLASSEFELFVYSLAPDYRLPNSAV